MGVQDVMVVMAAVVGIVVGFMIVPTVSGVKFLVMRLVASMEMSRFKRRGMAAKGKPLAKQTKKMTVVGSDPISAAHQKRSGRLAISVKESAVSVSDTRDTVKVTKTVRRGRPSNAEKARRVAEVAKISDVKNKRRGQSAKSVKKTAISVTKTKKTVEGKKVRCGRPSNLEVARRAAEAAKIADVRIGEVDDIFQGTDVIVNAGVHQQLLELSSEQLFALAVMRENQLSSLQETGSTAKETVSNG